MSENEEEIKEWIENSDVYEDNDNEDEEWEEDEEITPDNCSMGNFSPGTEECEFCPHYDFCAGEFRRRVKGCMF